MKSEQVKGGELIITLMMYSFNGNSLYLKFGGRRFR
jgi:hypothetical protein